ncbi:MraY family glycosyltransferase [Motiliproteus sediminis]|uniref:MraY family glycosyltransferase n=1 Tax=Motiliproteus sediminis TaxID=1468178 RepID=UPI001AEF5827|nr:glycosyltransferase family 4 protein [Motiliproteus sediminis]
MHFSYGFLFIALFGLAVGSTWIVLRLLRFNGVIDHPNVRSSHQVPTPSGGGVGFVIPFIACCVWLFFEGHIDRAMFMTLGLGGGGIAFLGFWDDVRNLSARLRIAIQSVIVLWVLWWVGDLWLYDLIPLPGVAVALVALASLWLLNLYNFMDGIDGLAAVEALCISAGAVVLLWQGGASEDLVVLWLGLIACVGGFLCFNWPPARIFMGDVGSCFLGLIIAALALTSLQQQFMSLWGWIILTALFWTDATLTLLRRIGRGETWHQAHRSHAYQILSRRWGSHRSVTLLAAGINLLWLIPLALVESGMPDNGPLLALVACVPLLVAQWLIGAGDSRIA